MLTITLNYLKQKYETQFSHTECSGTDRTTNSSCYTYACSLTVIVFLLSHLHTIPHNITQYHTISHNITLKISVEQHDALVVRPVPKLQ